ncbi:hypothetical protein [Bacillus atrophaeus]|uniref:HK97 gp10 family phage protein n=2 Tax=Bacillus atrophaeus TaxID=1452 RepID=A0ABM5LYE2_BACA1|nr:hypothetical protein [Bacillus atrophaeus]AMR62311.1 hypothetical protein A1D11_07780 [Bacillus subtilis subsp. globigii]ADP32899.1 hypothetical protein BATR1942_09830 [Bacillus atrophaeus 1942]AIK48481.1 hypothetical protein DJ95_1853 [Bacillus atrophaeus subsp. globigii]EIM12314.1 hypothetical protein UY9_03521 [Bacillus atrophaeus C89]KAA6454976.1 hypothetical protein DX926_02740 [Bacillus atrophaeus]
MARFSVRADFVDRSKLISRQIKRTMEGAVLDVTLDMKRVASMSAPHKSGFLEKQAQHEIYASSNYIEGAVSFSAAHNGFNYAKWTHDADYKLGDKSEKKRGGRSRFGGGAVPVGKGYLENTLSMNRSGYMNYLEEKYRQALS